MGEKNDKKNKKHEDTLDNGNGAEIHLNEVTNPFEDDEVETDDKVFIECPGAFNIRCRYAGNYRRSEIH